MRSGSEWRDLGRSYKSDKARKAALEQLRRDPYADRVEYREAQNVYPLTASPVDV